MIHQLTGGSRCRAGALALALAVVSSVSCLAAMPRESGKGHHACCAAMAEGCGSAATVNTDCCEAEVLGLAPAAPFTLAPLAVGVLLWSPSAVPRLTSAASNPDLSNPIGPPTYLLDSVFRI